MTRNWKQVGNIEDAKRLVDFGVIITWNEAKRLRKSFSSEESQALVEHLAVRLSEPSETRLVDEVLIETLLKWIANSPDESAMSCFLETFLSVSDIGPSATKLVDVALTTELTEEKHQEELYSIAVSLICELGVALHILTNQKSEPSADDRRILDHIATYLLSVSNSNNACIRLSLLNYFGSTEFGTSHKNGFNKVLSRFGHTVLDHLFELLFNKKTEAVAIEYLLDNLKFVLEADRHAQSILHETFKFYMLKNPERFALFLRTFAKDYSEIPGFQTNLSRFSFFQHLGALLRVVAEVKHKALTQTILSCLAMFDGIEERNDIIDALLELPEIHQSLRDVLRQMRNAVDSSKVIASSSRFSESKRGRRPSFSRAKDLTTVNQVQFLANHLVANAS